MNHSPEIIKLYHDSFYGTIKSDLRYRKFVEKIVRASSPTHLEAKSAGHEFFSKDQRFFGRN